MTKFELDAEQTDAILELKIYRLARLEILVIRKELEDKRRRVRQNNTLLKDESARWDVVRVELEEIQKQLHRRRDPDRRRPPGACDPDQGRGGQLPLGPGPRRDPDQADVPRRPRARLRRVHG
ncbi:MAG: hypothetical protein H0X67_15980 [Acidobacteria bacterium]|nr:hypothetical protein [Acidobacteriota bacterium]